MFGGRRGKLSVAIAISCISMQNLISLNSLYDDLKLVVAAGSGERLDLVDTPGLLVLTGTGTSR